MSKQPAQAPLVAEWVRESLDKWIADCAADPSGFALWAAQRFRSCRTQIVELTRQLEQAKRTNQNLLEHRGNRVLVSSLMERAEQAEREKERLVEVLELAKPWIGVAEDHRGRWCPPEVKQEVSEALSEQNND